MAKGKLAKKDQWEQIPISYSSTTGDIQTGWLKAYKRDGFLFIDAYNMNRAAQTSVGSNMYAANITGLPDFSSGMFATYYGTATIIAAVWDDGNGSAHLEARVLGNDLAANSKVTVRGFLAIID